MFAQDIVHSATCERIRSRGFLFAMLLAQRMLASHMGLFSPYNETEVIGTSLAREILAISESCGVVIPIHIFPGKVGETSTSFGQFSYLCPKKPEGARRSSDLYCLSRKNYELAQKNKTECFQVLNMASLAWRNLQAISLLPDMLWQYQREVWLFGNSEICVTVE